MSVLDTFIHDPLVGWSRGRVSMRKKNHVDYKYLTFVIISTYFISRVTLSNQENNTTRMQFILFVELEKD